MRTWSLAILLMALIAAQPWRRSLAIDPPHVNDARQAVVVDAAAPRPTPAKSSAWDAREFVELHLSVAVPGENLESPAAARVVPHWQLAGSASLQPAHFATLQLQQVRLQI